MLRVLSAAKIAVPVAPSIRIKVHLHYERGRSQSVPALLSFVAHPPIPYSDMHSYRPAEVYVRRVRGRESRFNSEGLKA